MTKVFTPIYDMHNERERYSTGLDYDILQQKKIRTLQRIEKTSRDLQEIHNVKIEIESLQQELLSKQKQQPLSPDEHRDLSKIQIFSLPQLEQKATKWQNHLNWLQTRLDSTEYQLAQHQQHLRARTLSP